MITHPAYSAYSPWRHAGVVLRVTCLGLLANAMLAPVRPWGWAGSTTSILALVMSVGAARANAGPPRRHQWARMIAGAAPSTACVKWLPALVP